MGERVPADAAKLPFQPDFLGGLAEDYVQLGEIEHATDMATRMAILAGRINSARADTRLRFLAGRLEPYRSNATSLAFSMLTGTPPYRSRESRSRAAASNRVPQPQ